MNNDKVYPVKPAFAAHALLNRADYDRLYAESVNNPEAFWGEQAEQFLHWFGKWETVLDWDFRKAYIRWFDGGQLNVSYNCLDRHLEHHGDQVALIWEGDDPTHSKKITYRELHAEVCRFANALKARNIQKGDRVGIYMPMVPETVVAMLACARIGAIHTVVFSGFSPEALKDRLLDVECCALVTADEGRRGGKRIPLRAHAEAILTACPGVHTVFNVRLTGSEVDWQHHRDVWYQEAIAAASPDCPAEPMDAEDPLFILHTSGSTGRTKGLMHTTAGYLLYAAMTYRYIFDHHPGDVFWCTADLGWVAGHSYVLYGPLCNAATTVLFEGVPTYPDASRFWQVVDKHQVTVFHTAPTAIRSLMNQGDAFVQQTSRSSLRLLGTVGEPIQPRAWEWYHQVVGEGRCPVVDTWCQTETGGILIAPLPGAMDLKPGSATLPFFGVVPEIIDEQGVVQEGPATGILTIAQPWPGMVRTVYGDHHRFVETYFAAYPGRYLSGDGGRRDEDGYYWITDRVGDDTITVSGHNLGTAEMESALILHEKVAEASVVGYPHSVKGQCICAFVTLMEGVEPDERLRKELNTLLRKEIGPIAHIDVIQWAANLPKTHSGKIARRVLRKIVTHDQENLGDTSHLSDPGVVQELVKARQPT
ncbi:MAG: acetate--CoA ligase [Magnetococcales bacterium]|nr:acetate--CoA ligase [Magnetococcales bacterium]